MVVDGASVVVGSDDTENPATAALDGSVAAVDTATTGSEPFRRTTVAPAVAIRTRMASPIPAAADGRAPRTASYRHLGRPT
jgi:hypothetical protein